MISAVDQDVVGIVRLQLAKARAAWLQQRCVGHQGLRPIACLPFLTDFPISWEQ